MHTNATAQAHTIPTYSMRRAMLRRSVSSQRDKPTQFVSLPCDKPAQFFSRLVRATSQFTPFRFGATSLPQTHLAHSVRHASSSLITPDQLSATDLGAPSWPRSMRRALSRRHLSSLYTPVRCVDLRRTQTTLCDIPDLALSNHTSATNRTCATPRDSMRRPGPGPVKPRQCDEPSLSAPLSCQCDKPSLSSSSPAVSLPANATNLTRSTR